MRSASPRGHGAYPPANPSPSSPRCYGAFPPANPAPSSPLAPATAPAVPPGSRTAALLSRLRDQGRALVATQRPWGQLLDSAALARPPSAGEALSRLRRNLGYFRSNYALTLLVALTLGLIWQPASLAAAIALAAAWFFLYLARDGPLVLFERRFEDSTVLGLLSVATFFAMFSTDLGSNVFRSMAVGLLLVAMHAIFRLTDDLFLDEREAVSGGLVAGMGVAVPQNYVVRVV